MTSGPIKDIFSKARASHLNGDRETAIRHIRAILQQDPDNAEAYNDLGLLLYESGSVAIAIDCYKKSIVLNPNHAEVCCNCANALLSLGVLREASEYFEKALSLNKELYEALFGSGAVKQAEGDLTAAKKIFCDCLRIRPDDGAAHFKLGTIMREWNMLDLAAVCYKNALRFRPGDSRARMNLGETLQSAGEIEESEKVFGDLIAYDTENHLAHSNLFISMNYNPVHSPDQIYDAHVRWGAGVESWFSRKINFKNAPDPDRVLRIGYVSSDLCRHPVASFLEPVLKGHDRTKFVVTCYSQGVYKDEKTEELKKYADNWREIRSFSNEEAMQMIHRDVIDILIDCTGHMADNRLPLFARRCAPIQIAWIGYPNTTGLKSIDYRFTDSIVDPENYPELYTEKLVRLANGFCVWAPPDNAPPVADSPCLKNGVITFGSLHTLSRLNKKVIELWSRALAGVSGSRLVIFRNTLNDEIIKRISEWFSENNIDLRRVVFQRDVPPEGHLSVYQSIDIALDTFPWSGHTTACESLWMGVPVISLRGDRAAGRMVASILTHVGMQDWMAETPEQYIELVRHFSIDKDKLAGIRKSLRDKVKSSALCDGKACTSEVEMKLREMWVKWCGDQK
jgi:protein O-GlcNAc transferase